MIVIELCPAILASVNGSQNSSHLSEGGVTHDVGLELFPGMGPFS